MLRMSLIAVIAVLIFCSGGYAQSEGVEPGQAVSAEAREATPQEMLIPSLSDAQMGQLRIWLEDLKKPNAKRARTAITSLGAGAVPPLLGALEDRHTVQGQQIIEILGRIRHPAALPKLKEIILGDNEWLRSAAVFAIGEIGGKEAVPILLESLRDPSCRVCEISIQVLAGLGDLRAAPGLIDLLRSRDSQLVEAAAQALVQLTNNTEDYGSDWMSWQLWYESEVLFGGLGNGNSEP